MSDYPDCNESERRSSLVKIDIHGPSRSEGALLYLKSFFGSEARKNDRGFHKFAGTDGKDIQQGEDRTTLG